MKTRTVGASLLPAIWLAACSNGIAPPADVAWSDTPPGIDASSDAPRDSLAPGDTAADDAPDVRDAPTADVPAPADAGCVHAGHRDTWVVSATAAIDRVARDALIALIDARGIRAIYFNPALLLDSTSGQAQLADFLRAMNARCVRVELLYGNRAWSSADTTTVQTRARLAATFAARFPDVRIDALHFDIEPHLDPLWSSDRNAAANLYLDALAALGPIARGAGMQMVVDITHWYWTIDVTRAGRTAPLDELLAPLVDRFVIMDYWGTPDAAATQTRLVSQAQHAAATARAASRAWTVGLNVSPGGPANETLADEGRAALDAAIGALDVSYGGTPGYAGTAVYDSDGYAALGP